MKLQEKKAIKAESGPRSASASLLKGARLRPAALEAAHHYDYFPVELCPLTDSVREVHVLERLGGVLVR